MTKYNLNDADAAYFWERVEKTKGCWLWNGKVDGGGYPIMTRARRTYRAARVSLELTGVRTDRFEVSAIQGCGDQSCVRPDHLRMLTRGESARRAYSARTTGRDLPYLPSPVASAPVEVPVEQVARTLAQQGLKPKELTARIKELKELL